MLIKTFAEVLKNNLANNQTEMAQNRLDLNCLLDPFLMEIKPYYITLEKMPYIYDSIFFHQAMFNSPVELVFFWREEDYQGEIFAVYKYKNKYIYIKGQHGSCELCDKFPRTEEELMRTFRSLKVTDNVDEIQVPYQCGYEFEDFVMKNKSP